MISGGSFLLGGSNKDTRCFLWCLQASSNCFLKTMKIIGTFVKGQWHKICSFPSQNWNVSSLYTYCIMVIVILAERWAWNSFFLLRLSKLPRVQFSHHQFQLPSTFFFNQSANREVLHYHLLSRFPLAAFMSDALLHEIVKIVYIIAIKISLLFRAFKTNSYVRARTSDYRWTE